ncbi:phosphohydrolase [Agromyces protaetiae]|uniref:Phosphohydrolase n=1 Tax=Agromyces protaetiae TaxID=2509455 RepID=A0A4P6FF32_9MICO|nr:phosphohydrolase [Agromyces protaetiae]
MTVDELLAAWAALAGDEDVQWATAHPGPSVASVAARLAAVPRPFLDDGVSVPALAGDVLGGSAAALVAQRHSGVPAVRLGASIGLWLVASEEQLGAFDPPLAYGASATGAGSAALAVDALALRVAPVADPLDWIADDDRREEAVRTFLLWSGFLPAGEDVEAARAALAARDSLARNRVLAEGYAEHRHRAEIARRLADARAREAAARYSTE